MPFLVDGYNLLRQIEKMSDEPTTDIQMCQILGRYFRNINDTCQIIFDGIGPPDKSGMFSISNVEVIFSGSNVEADEVIEQKISANTAPKRLSVVSSDIRIRKAARVRKAQDIKSDIFWLEVIKEINKKTPTKEPAQKRDGLTKGETDEWLDIFGLDD